MDRNKIIAILVIVILAFVILVGTGAYIFFQWGDKQALPIADKFINQSVSGDKSALQENEEQSSPVFDNFAKQLFFDGESGFNAKNSSFEIDGIMVTLKDGESQIAAAPGSASKITTRYFGNGTKSDLNDDGHEEIFAFFVTQDRGGSGLFYYVVVALKAIDGYRTTNAFFIGDRIAPQSMEVNASAVELRVNYAERKPGEPFTVQPSIGVTKILKITPDGKLTDLTQ